jgi:cytosine/adenosine deaminase-related metal-dependent hydrolase
VDGSASNDGADLLGEARQAMLLARVGHGPAAMNARQALELATLGGARVLGRDDIGALAPGMSADLIAFRSDTWPCPAARCTTRWPPWCSAPPSVDMSLIIGAPW